MSAAALIDAARQPLSAADASTLFDAIFGGDLVTPALTTVETPLEDIAERAVRLLIGESVDEKPLTTRLIVRESS